MNKFVLLTHKDKRAYFEVAAAHLYKQGIKFMVTNRIFG